MGGTKMTFTRRIMLASTIALGLSSGLSGAVSAAETINMTAIDGYPERSMWVKEFSGFFIPRVNEELAVSGNYKINWLEAYGGQIVKPRGVLEGVKLGLGDIALLHRRHALQAAFFLSLEPLESQARYIDAVGRRRVVHRTIFSHGGVVKSTWTNRHGVTKQVFADDDQGQAGRADVFLCAAKGESYFRPIDAAR